MIRPIMPTSRPVPPMTAEEELEFKRYDTRWKSDVDKKLDALVSFSEKYDNLLDVLLKRERERERLRRAVIEKTLAGATWALIAFMVTAVISYAKDFFHRS